MTEIIEDAKHLGRQKKRRSTEHDPENHISIQQVVEKSFFVKKVCHTRVSPG